GPARAGAPGWRRTCARPARTPTAAAGARKSLAVGEMEIVRIRVTGPPPAVDQLAADLEAAGLPWCDVRGVSAPYTNHGRDGDVRRYLTVLVPIRSSDVNHSRCPARKGQASAGLSPGERGENRERSEERRVGKEW